MRRTQPRSTLFPYTTLFRSRQRPGGAGPEEVFVRYLGAGGLYLEWRGTPILVGPFFSNPSFPRAYFGRLDRKSTRLNSSHGYSSYAVFCLKKKKDQRYA